LAQREWFSTHTWALIRENPERFVQVTSTRCFCFWWFATQTGVLYPPAWRLLYQVYYIGVLIFAFVGVRRLARDGGQPAARAVEPMLVALTGGGVAALLRRNRPMVVIPGSPQFD